MQQLTEQDYKKILICLTLYITSLFAANTLGIKLMPFFFGTHLSVAVFSFPIVFIMTDVIGEVYGKKMANNFVIVGIPELDELLPQPDVCRIGIVLIAGGKRLNRLRIDGCDGNADVAIQVVAQ